MVVDIRPIDELKLNLISGTQKPVSFLVGAPISWDGGQGVPSVHDFLSIIRKRFEGVGAQALEMFDKKVSGSSPAELYQEAMGFLFSTLDPEVATEVVQSAVLMARKADVPELDLTAPGDDVAADWHISRGIKGLARLIKAQPDRFTGPIFTTNFDPLIGLALTEAGMRPQAITIPMDGSINAPLVMTDDQINVFHLHGYWRNSPNLHTRSQLTAERPQLQQSLEQHLRGRTLVVLAYGGWDDIFTTALANCLNNDAFKGSVRWCFYGTSSAEIKEQNAHLFAKFQGGIQQERITFYAGIDCHTFFDELLADLGIAPNELAAIEASPLVGWELASAEFLNSLDPLRSEEVVRYFDGAVPTWRHAISPLIPRLSHVEALSSHLTEGLRDMSACHFQLVRAAGGEGKSTALLQAAADAVRTHDWTVLYRTSVDTGLNSEVVADLDPDRNWLLVADEGEGLVDDLWACAERLHHLGRSNVFFLLAARDTDWRVVNGDSRAWSTRLNKFDDLMLGGVSTEDAGRVVVAWTEQGDAGLRALMAAKSHDERVQKLVNATRAQDVRGGDGSFFGGLLETRFSKAALIDHVVILMEPLRGHEIVGTNGTLYDALIYIAACHAVGIPGIDKRILASLLDVSPQRVSSIVVRPLGRELGAAESGGHILTRHRRVAEAVIVASEVRFDTDLCDVWAALVEHTIILGRDNLVSRECHGPIINAGTTLKRNLPKSLSEQRRGEIGIASANAAYEHDNGCLTVATGLARAYRFAGDPEAACQILSRDIRTASKKVDFAQVIRGYFYEWSTCEGNLSGRQGSLADTWLASISISDSLRVELTLEDAKLTCAGLGVAFGELHSGGGDGIFAKGRRAVTDIGWLTNPDPRAVGYFERYEHELDELGTPKPQDTDEAIAWLEQAAHAAYEEMDDGFLRSLQKGGRLSFAMLRDLLAPTKMSS